MTLNTDINVFLLLDGAKLNAPRVTYQHDDAPWADWLYRGTRHAPALEVSPYLVMPSDDSRIWDQQSAWAENGIVLKAKTAPGVLIEHLRSLLSARMPSGQLGYFRFYANTHLLRFLNALTESERNLFSGPIVEWRTLGADGSWHSIETSGHTEAKTSESEGWFQLSEAHIRAMNDSRAELFRARLMHYLGLENRPETVAQIEDLIQQAQGQGFRSEKDLVRYTEMAVCQPEYLRTEACQAILGDMGMANFQKLDRLDHQLAYGGA